MWTLMCLIPAVALFAHQIRRANRTLKKQPPTMADIPVIVLIGDEFKGDL